MTFLSTSRILAFAALLALAAGLAAQEAKVQYAIVDMAFSGIERPQALSEFFDKLRRLEKGELEQVRIVHLGDSHVQADLFTGPLRRSLQKHFGYAGRGMMTAYRAVGTTSPEDLDSATNIEWKLVRAVTPDPDLPIGVSGMTLFTRDPRFAIKVGFRGEETDTFDTVKIYTPNLKNQFAWRLAEHKDPRVLEKLKGSVRNRKVVIQAGDSLGHLALRHNVSVADLRRWNKLKNDLIFPGHTLNIRVREVDPGDVNRKEFTAWPSLGERGKGRFAPLVFNLDKPHRYIYLMGQRREKQQIEARLYGLSLEKRHSRGILYHTIGVNSARAWHYIQDPGFAAQVRELEPDLLILSLGANEAMRPSIKQSEYESEMRKLALSIAKRGVAVLVTTPPDTLKDGNAHNKNMKAVWGALDNLCEEEGFAIWPFHKIMGGQGSMSDWSQAGLAQDDQVHLSRKGYRMQGRLLFHSLLEAYVEHGKR